MRDQAFIHVVHRYVIHPSSQAVSASVNPYSFNLLERALSALSPVLPHASARPSGFVFARRARPRDARLPEPSSALALRGGREDLIVNRNRPFATPAFAASTPAASTSAPAFAPCPPCCARRAARMLVLCAALLAMPMLAVHAREAQAQTSAPAAKLSNEQLDSLTAPVALYPDALLAQVLMAATYPSEVTRPPRGRARTRTSRATTP